MRKQKHSNVRLVDLQSKPFHEVLPLIVDLDDRSFWWIVNWLSIGK